MKYNSYIDKIEFFVPPTKLTNKKLVDENPSWDVDKIYNKTGIKNRYIADINTTATDLAVDRAGKKFDKGLEYANATIEILDLLEKL